MCFDTLVPCRRLSWPVVGDLGQHLHGKVCNIPWDEKFNRMHEALSDQDYLTGWDVYAEFKSLSAA
jgi:hypothetical protein